MGIVYLIVGIFLLVVTAIVTWFVRIDHYIESEEYKAWKREQPEDILDRWCDLR